MHEELLEIAREQPILSELDRLTGKTIRFAKLQFTDQVQRHQSDDVGHFHHRNERAKVFGKNTTANITPDEFFSRALQMAEKEPEYTKQLTLKSKNKFLEITGNTVGIIGQPGMGKTTFTETLLKKYAEDCKLYDSELVFHLKFRNIVYKKESNILQFLAQRFDKDKVYDALLDRLESSLETLIIMDGLDEANINWSKEDFSKIDIHSKNTAEVFIKNILKGTVLSKAKKLITSRPGLLNSLSDDFRPQFCVNIIGLDENAQKQICGDICGDKSKDVYSYVQDHPDLLAYCHVPFNCIIVMASVFQLKTEKPESSDLSLPCTLTGILTVALNNFLKSKHHQGKLMYKKIANFAWDGFKENKICFEESDIEKAKLTKDDLKNMFITIFKKHDVFYSLSFFCATKKVTYFCHLIMQEFFVALKLLFFMPVQKMKNLFSSEHQSSLDDARFEMVVKFMFGLCNETTFKYFLVAFPQIPFPKNQAELLKENLEKKFSFDKFNDDNENCFHNFDGSFLRFLGWIYELQDKEFTSKIAQTFPDRIKLQCTMLLTDFEPLHYFFQSRKKPILIESVIPRSHFYGDCWKSFLGSHNWENTLIEVSYRFINIYCYNIQKLYLLHVTKF